MNDALLQALIALTEEQAIAERSQLPWLGESNAAIRLSPSYQAFAEAAAGEGGQLSQLMMPGATLHVGHELGGYESTMPDGVWIVNQLLQDGKRLTEAQGKTGKGALRQNLEVVLTGFLSALSTGKCRTTSYLAFRGLSIEENEADIGVGVLRRLTPEEVLALASPEDSAPNIEDELCLVLESEATWTVTSTPDRSGTWVPKSLASHDASIALLVLSGASDNHGNVRAPHFIWSRKSPYFYTGGAGGGGYNPNLYWRTSNFYNAIVTPAVARRARQLYPALVKASQDSLHVVLRRLVSAALVYDKTPEDRLVDAAVAWEALFGSKTHDQLSLQLALGMAWLLAPNDFTERQRIFHRAKTIYGLRSKLVHGGTAKSGEVETASTELIEWLRAAAVALITTHSPLLPDKDRVRSIYLQDPGNLATGSTDGGLGESTS